MQHTTTDYCILHLSLIDGIGPVTITRIINALALHGLENLYHMSAHDIMQQCALSRTQSEKIMVGLADTSLVERERQLIANNAVSWCTLSSPVYPQSLKTLHVPPPVMYWRGTMPVYRHGVAIVGSRNANQYGQRVIDRLLPGLVGTDCVIISGGALGIDTMAHRKTLELGGKTIVVLGSGMLHWYPYDNKKLFSALLEHGNCIMSPFPLSTEPLPGNFPARNRIIAGLAQATVVVQAAAKSGALITARYALDQGREVMAVPGPIDDPLSQGCHELIAQGAALASDAQAIMQILGIQEHQAEAKNPQKCAFSHNIEVQDNTPLLGINDRILMLCSQPRSTDELMNQGLDHEGLIELLFELQLTGRIDQDVRGRWKTVV